MKNKIKKSLSLIMAVLMVLSCWVWIAPEKAEAGLSSYTFKVKAYIDNPAESVKVTISYWTNNGTGTQTSQEFTWGDAQSKEKSDDEESWTVPGWPYHIYFHPDSSGLNKHNIQLKEMWINDKQLFNDNWKMEANMGKDNNVKFAYDGSGGSENSWDPTKTWGKPTIVASDGSIGDLSISLNEIGGADKTVTGTFNKWVDQYGVDWTGTYSDTDFEYYLALAKDAAASNTFTDPDGNNVMWVSSTSGNKATVTAKAALQMYHLYSEAQGQIPDIYLVAKRDFAGDSATTAKIAYSSAKIKLTYPKYDWKFYGNGNGTVRTEPATKIEMAAPGTDGTPVLSYVDNDVVTSGGYKYYGQSIKDYYPTGNATKEGYTFYGFWSVQQPGSIGHSSEPYAFEADFVQPIDTETYNTMSDEQKALYYPAGVKWNPKNSDLMSTKTSAENVYYAWWLSDDVDVKFYDIDGKFLHEDTVKYGQSQAVVTWPTPTESYSNGALSYSNWNGKWKNIDGTEVNAKGHTFTRDLILTPLYETVESDYEYSVHFYGTNGWLAGNDAYKYRDTAVVPTNPGTLSDDPAYTYEFVGWSLAKPITTEKTGNVHIVLEDGDFDTEGHAINLVNDFTVRSDAEYYAVFRRFLRSYDVTFKYRNDRGEWVGADINSDGEGDGVKKTFKYGEVITAPDGVPAAYATKGYEYKFKSWTLLGNDVNLNTQQCTGSDVVYIADYTDGVPTPYTVTFEYYNEKGEVVTQSAQVNHGSKITQETVDLLKPFENYDNGTALVTFNGEWEYNGQKYKTADLTEFSPENHVTFKAVYDNPKNFYTVTYVDGSNTQSYRITDGTALPYWTYKVTEGETTTEKEYLPSRADTVEGKYAFIGWFDAKQDDIAQTNGNQYIPGTTPVTGNVVLYPQFSFGKFEYHIVFNNYDGAELAKGTFNFGDSLENLINEAERKAVRAADETYTYQFIGWDKKVPTFCEGGEPDSTLTFTAQYKPVYIYYDIEWFNDKAAMEAEDGKPVATSKYVYGDKIRTPSATLTPPTSEDADTTYVFAGWKYLENGVEKDYNRNLTVTGNMKLYATYVEAPKSYKVTVIVDADNADKNYSLTVQSGQTLTDLISDPVSGYLNETEHSKFNGWVTKITQEGAEQEVDYDLALPVTDNVTIYATFMVSDHVYDQKEVTKVPTYPVAEVTDDEGNILVEGSDGKGELTKWCECDTQRVNTKKEAIAALTDIVAPTGTGYIGTQWKTGDDINKVVYANPNTDLIITTTDMGDVNNEFNPTGLGIGVAKIEACILDSDTVLTSKADGGTWTTVYDWPTIQKSLIEYYGSWDKVPAMYQNYSANATAKLGNYSLTDGNEYIAYAVITDKNGNETFMRTAAFVYDATAPEMTIDGDSNTAGDIFCETAVITTQDASDVTVSANDAEITPDNDGKCFITEPGTYKVVATDKAGNKTTEYIQVVKHEYRKVTTPATCTQDGYIAQTCYNCGDEKDLETPEELECKGHLALKTVITEATCTAAGTEHITCSACGLDEYNDVIQDETGAWVDKYPALDHDWSNWAVVKEATCVKDGLERRSCARCALTETQAIAADENAHNFYAAVRLAPTCTQNGKRTQTCRLCGEVVVLAQADDENAANYDAAYKATGHSADEADESNWVVTTAATCGSKGSKKLVCEVCAADMGKTKEIPATGEHIWEYDAENSKEPTTTEKGVIAYKCKNCVATKTEEVAAIVEYAVVFMSEDGKTKLGEIKRVAGTSIGDDMPEDPEKAATDLYRYEFAGWFTADDKEYKASTPVNSNLTLYAKFNQKNVYYTLQYMTYKDGKLEETEVFMELMGAVGDTRLPSYNPSIPADKNNSYEFEGWYTSDNQLFDGKITAEAADRTITAKFKSVPQEYDVVFLDWDGTGLGKVTVKAGETAVWNGATPTRAADKENHYTFAGWDGVLTNITATTRVKATYNPVAHIWNDGEVTQKQSCTLAEKTTYTCTVETCKYQKVEETKPALNHPVESWETTFDSETGMNKTVCKLCGTTVKEEKASYTIVLLNHNGSRLDTISNVQVNAYFRDQAAAVESKAIHAPDAEYFYYFAGWVLQGTTAPVYKSNELPAATADATYVATYTTSPRTYTVTFAKSDNTAVVSFTGIKYKSTIDDKGYDIRNYQFDEAVYGIPAADANVHWTFEKWDVDLSGGVTADIAIRPKYESAKHDFDKNNDGKLTDADDAVPSQATCTQSGGYKYTCEDCGYSYVNGNVPALKHNYVTTTIKEPTYDSEGLNKLVCQRCGDTITETIPAKQYIVVEVSVKDTAGNNIEGAKVTITHNESGKKYGPNLSNKSGIATFYVEESGDYFVTILEIPGHDGGVSGDITVDNDGKITNNTVPSVKGENSNCSCGCHRDGFWGMLFRFFHKIIKLFAGKYICCDCPDGRY